MPFNILSYLFNKLESRVKKTIWYRNSIPDLSNYPIEILQGKSVSADCDVVNLGSSSAVFDFCYDGLALKAYNWALKPQSMEYSFKVLQQYYACIKTDGVVLIPFSPFSGLSVDGKWDSSANDKYFHLLSKEFIDNYAQVADRCAHPFFKYPKESLKRLIHDVPPFNMYAYNFVCKTEEDYVKNAKIWINIWMKEFNITDLNQPLSMENQNGRASRLQTVRSLIDFCLDKHLRPVIVITPVHRELLKYFTTEFKKNYITSFMSEVNTQNIEILDYLHEGDFTDSSEYVDAFFMNKEGGCRYTRQIMLDLNILKA